MNSLSIYKIPEIQNIITEYKEEFEEYDRQYNEFILLKNIIQNINSNIKDLSIRIIENETNLNNDNQIIQITEQRNRIIEQRNQYRQQYLIQYRQQRYQIIIQIPEQIRKLILTQITNLYKLFQQTGFSQQQNIQLLSQQTGLSQIQIQTLYDMYVQIESKIQQNDQFNRQIGQLYRQIKNIKTNYKNQNDNLNQRKQNLEQELIKNTLKYYNYITLFMKIDY